jgi:hypothetical protein
MQLCWRSASSADLSSGRGSSEVWRNSCSVCRPCLIRASKVFCRKDRGGRQVWGLGEGGGGGSAGDNDQG